MQPRNLFIQFKSLAALTAAILVGMLGFGDLAHAGNTWTGGGASTNWSDNNNWGGAAPGYGTLTFTTGGTQGTTSSDNSITSMNQLLWTGSASWTLNQGGSTVLSLFDNGGTQAKVENQSSGLVTINLPITFAANNGSPPNPFGEINAVNGDLTFATGTLTVNGSSVNGIKLFGSSRTVNFNTTVSASGKWFGYTDTIGNTINVGGSFTSSDFYVMNGATLNLNSGGTLSTALRLGGDFGNTGSQNQTLTGIFNLAAAAGGQTFSGVVNSVSGNTSGTLAVNSQNTSGANALSGHLALDSALKITQSAGGTLNITQTKGVDTTTGTDIKGNTLTLTPASAGTITHSGTIYNSTGAGGVTMTGAGTNIYSAAHTYSGDTLINAGTLQINSGGSANSSIIRIGDTAANSPAATLSAGSGASFTSTLVVRPSASGTQGTRTIAGSDATSTATISGGVFLDADATVTNVSGGTLAFTGTQFDLKNQTLTVNNSGTVTMSSSTALQNSTGSGKLVKSGTGTLTLSGASTYTGGTTLNTGGTLNINNATAIGTGALTIGGSGTLDNTSGAAITLANNNALTISGGSPTFTGGSGTTHDLNFGSGTVTVSGANRTLTVSAGTLTLGGGVTDSGGTRTLIKAGAGTLVLNGAAGTWTGGSEIDAGILSIGNDTALGTGSLSLHGGTLQSSGGTRALGNNILLDVSGGTIGGAAAITVNGTFTEGNASRTLTVNNSALTSLAGNVYLAPDNTTAQTMTVGGTGNLTISGIVANNNFGNTVASALAMSGSGALTLNNANTYSGGTTISGGALKLGNNSGAGTGSMSLSGGIIQLANSVTLANNITTTYGFEFLDVPDASASAIYSGIVTGNSGSSTSPRMRASGSGATLIFNGTLNAGGKNFVWTQGNLVVSNSGSINGTLGLALGRNSTASGANVTIKNNGVISLGSSSGTSLGGGAASGSIGLTIQDSGSFSTGTANFDLHSSTTSTATTAVNLNGGTLTAGALIKSQVGANQTSTLNFNGGTLKAGAASASFLPALTGLTANVLAGGAKIDDGGFAITIAQNLLTGASPDGGLNKSGNGTLTLSGANTYNGPTTVSAGTLSVSGNGNLGTAPSSATAGNVLLNGGALSASAGFTLNANRGIALGPTSGSGSGTLDVASSQTLTYNGIATNNGTSSSGLTKTSGGTLTLGGANTYYGNTTISAGTLQLGVSGAVPSGGSTTGWLVLDGGASAAGTFDLNGFNQTVNALSGVTGTVLGQIVNNSNGGTSALTVNDGQTTTFAGLIKDNNNATAGKVSLTLNGSGTLTLSGANTYTGPTTISGGVLSANLIANGGTASAIGQSANSAANLVLDGGTLRNTGASTSQSSDHQFTMTQNGGTIDASQGSGRLQFTPAGAPALTMIGSGNRTLFLTGTGGGQASTTRNEINMTIGDPSSGITSLSKFGSGSWTISTAGNTYSGDTTISAGTLEAIVDAPFPSGTGKGNLVINNGATFAIHNQTVGINGLNDGAGGGGTITTSIAGTKALTVGNGNASGSFSGTINFGSMGLVKTGSGTQTISGSSANTFSGTATVNNGTLELGKTGVNAIGGNLTVSAGTARITGTGGDQIPNAATVTVSGGTFDLQGNNETVGTVSLTSGSISGSGGTLTGSSYDVQSGTVSAILGGSGVSLTKSTGGTVTLSGANTYSGATTISAGTLTLGASGSVASTPTIAVASGALYDVSAVSGYTLGAAQTLKGNGSVNGAVIVNGTVAPGASIGTLTLSNTPTLNGSMVMEINNTNAQAADLLVIAGNPLARGGTLTVTNIGAALNGGDTFTLFNASGYSSTFSATNLPGLGTGQNWWTTNNFVNLIVNQLNASNANFTRAKNLTLKIAIADLFTNVASLPSGNTFMLTSVGTSTNGATIATNSTFIFFSSTNNLNESLAYSVTDARGGSVTGLLNIAVISAVGGPQTITVSGGAATVNFAGIPGFSYLVQRSTNLVDWLTLFTTNVPSNGLYSFTDTFSDLGTSPSSAYYRTAQP